MRRAIINFTESSLVNKLLFQSVQAAEKNSWYVEVDPKSIRTISRIGSSSPFITGEDANFGVYSGPWDRFTKSFNRYFMYTTVSQILKGEDVSDTIYYRKAIKKMSRQMAFEQVSKLPDLINTFEKEGYLSQYQLGKLHLKRRVGPYEIPKNEIVIGMGRDGHFIRLKGGRHRLAIAQQIGIKSIPAILTVVHKQAVNKLPEKRRRITGNPEDFRPF